MKAFSPKPFFRLFSIKKFKKFVHIRRFAEIVRIDFVGSLYRKRSEGVPSLVARKLASFRSDRQPYRKQRKSIEDFGEKKIPMNILDEHLF